MNAKQQFTQRLTILVTEKGWTWNGLAERLSEGNDRVYASTTTPWRDGAMPSGELMLRLPKIFGVNGHWLLTGEGPRDYVPPERAAVALAVIESVVDATRDQEAFDRFWGHWLEFRRLSEGDDKPDGEEVGRCP